jgi:hypothetical protein
MAKSFPNTGATVGLAADRSALASPFAGMQFFETDTKRNWLYNGSTWIPDDMVFTTEAARDAAITSPTEGMQAYLTAPTVPAATGATTLLPSGIKTIYNGSVWVCVTPIAAYNDTTGTTTSSSWTTTLSGGGTNVSVTLVTGTSVLLSMHIAANNNVASNSVSFTISVSGATTLAAASVPLNGRANSAINSQVLVATTSRVIGGLTAGTNTFTMNYVTSGGTTATIYERSLVAQGIA